MSKVNGDKLYFIGIGGSGMLPLAEIALSLGYKVLGSDVKDSAELEALRQRGATLFSSHLGNQIPDDAIVIFSTAIKEDNQELTSARKRSLKTWHRSEMLQHLMTGKKTITIAGTHGKTTSTAMVGHMLSKLGQDPTVYCGGILTDSQRSGLAGEGEYFVAEADESDGSFLNYSPFINLITNIGEDHLDHYGSMTQVLATFKAYLQRTSKEGKAILYWDNKLFHELVDPADGIDILTFGKRIGSDIRLYDVTYHPSETEFVAMVQRDRVKGRIKTIGEHNVINLLGALGVARALELDVNQAAESFASFQGVSRRLSLIFESDEIKIFDDYAHNPDKIAACLNALRQSWPNKTLHVIFQAHRYSRTETLYKEITASFSQANIVYVMPIYAAGETPSSNLSIANLTNDIAKASKTIALCCENSEDVINKVLAGLRNADVVISVGAGDVYKVTQGLKQHFTK